MHPNIRNHHKFKVLLIGGMDSSGGSGLQRDLEFQRNNDSLRIIPTFYSVQGEKSSLKPVDREYFNQCIGEIIRLWSCERVLIKLGAISEMWQLKKIAQLKCSLSHSFLLFDPVISSSLGFKFITNEALLYLREEFLKSVDLLTPNLLEFKKIFSIKHGDKSREIYEEAKKVGCRNILLKGGHHESKLDYFHGESGSFYLKTEFVNRSFRGTGCALGSLIIRGLSEGLCLEDSIVWAKSVLTRSLEKSNFYIEKSFKIKSLPRLYKEIDMKNYNFKKISTSSTRLYPIVSNFDELREVITSGIEIVQLRIKEPTSLDLNFEIQRCQKLCTRHGVLFFLNDYWEEAIENCVDGVHLGYEDLQVSDLKKIEEAGLFLGVSSHSYVEGAYMMAINPSYIALGPIYETTLKKMNFSAQGVDALRKWINLFDIPVVAIGGITLDNCEEVLRERPSFICSVQDIVNDPSPKMKSKKWVSKVEEICAP